MIANFSVMSPSNLLDLYGVNVSSFSSIDLGLNIFHGILSGAAKCKSWILWKKLRVKMFCFIFSNLFGAIGNFSARLSHIFSSIYSNKFASFIKGIFVLESTLLFKQSFASVVSFEESSSQLKTLQSVDFLILSVIFLSKTCFFLYLRCFCEVFCGFAKLSLPILIREHLEFQ